MGLAKFLAKHFSCKSSCVYNPDEEFFTRTSMSEPLSHYQLKIKDIKILNKREYIKYPTNNIEI